MKKLIWKLRYARYMQKQSGWPFMLCWESAAAWVESFDWEDEDPKDCASTEMGYWEE